MALRTELSTTPVTMYKLMKMLAMQVCIDSSCILYTRSYAAQLAEGFCIVSAYSLFVAAVHVA